jgi:hypothetical protein
MIEVQDSERFSIRGIPSHLVDRFWKYAEPYVKRALDHANGEFTPADLCQLCKDQSCQLWLVAEGDKIVAAMVTELVSYPRKRHCRFVTLAGSKAPEWTALADTIIGNWAREQGCVALEAFVRKGYVPVLAKHGFKHKYSAIFKELSDG